MATASTGIAAELFFEGATLHSKFKIPIDITDDMETFLDYENNYAVILRALDVIIIDEVSAAHKDLIRFVDRMLCRIDRPNNDLPFAGKVLIILEIRNSFFQGRHIRRRLETTAPSS